jgi:hypothetical protein
VVSRVSNGSDVSTKTVAPLSENDTDTTATSSVAVARATTCVPSMAAAPSAGSVMVTTGGTPFLSSIAMYCPMNSRVEPVVPFSSPTTNDWPVQYTYGPLMAMPVPA